MGWAPSRVSRWVAPQTGPVDDGAQASVVARIPGAAGSGWSRRCRCPLVPATLLADPAVDREAIAGRTPLRTADRRVAATVWWYSVSAVLVTPGARRAGDRYPAVGRLADTSLAFRPDGVPVAAVSSAPGSDAAAELRESLAAAVAAVAAVGRMGERPLWAIATDSIANQLLALGRALRDVPAATAHAAPLAAAIGVAAAGAALRRRRGRAVHPPGVLLPGGRAAGRGVVHVVPASAAGRAARAAGAGGALVLTAPCP